MKKHSLNLNYRGIFFVALSFAFIYSGLFAQTLQTNLPVTNGSVKAVLFDSGNNTIYMGGGLDKIGFVEWNGTSNSPKSYSFIDKSANGKNVYRLKQIDRDGKFVYSNEVEVVVNVTPKEFSLSQNYPNPFNPTISYTVRTSDLHASGQAGKTFQKEGNVLSKVPTTLKIYDVLGREVATLVNEVKELGNYSVQWNAAQYSSGIYFCRLTAGNFSKIIKLTLVW